MADNQHVNNLFVAAACSVGQLTLYFNRFACSALIVGNGINSAIVSSTEPWDGDAVTFTATLVDGATFGGWYSDISCTQLVSTSPVYTTTATADLTLYAKAATGVYLKANGTFNEAKAIYSKSNGSWSEVYKSVFDIGKKYRVIT